MKTCEILQVLNTKVTEKCPTEWPRSRWKYFWTNNILKEEKGTKRSLTDRKSI
jgi:hypothetical protein